MDKKLMRRKIKIKKKRPSNSGFTRVSKGTKGGIQPLSRNWRVTCWRMTSSSNLW